MIWPRTGTCGRILQTWWNFVFDIMWRVCQWAKEPLASQQELYHMELSSQSVSWLPIIRYLVYFPCIYWRSLFLMYTQAHNTHHAFLHNAELFSKSLYHSSGTVTARSCTISGSVTKWLTRTWHRSRLLLCLSERKHIEHTYVIKHATLYTVTHTHFYRAPTVKNATIKCE